MSSFIEFGDFSFSNVSSICDGVELPLSWSLKDSFNSSLCFFVPVEGEDKLVSFYELLSSLSTSQSIRKSSFGSLPDQNNGNIESKPHVTNEVKQTGCSSTSSIENTSEVTEIVNRNLQSVQNNLTVNLESVHTKSIIESNIMAEPLQERAIQTKLDHIPISCASTIASKIYNEHSQFILQASNETDQNAPNYPKSQTNDMSVGVNSQMNDAVQSQIATCSYEERKVILKRDLKHNVIPNNNTTYAISTSEVPMTAVLNGSASDASTDTNQLEQTDLIIETNNKNHIANHNDADETPKTVDVSNKTPKVILKRENSIPKPELVKPDQDPQAVYFATELANVKLICKPKSFIPRGLFN